MLHKNKACLEHGVAELVQSSREWPQRRPDHVVVPASLGLVNVQRGQHSRLKDGRDGVDKGRAGKCCLWYWKFMALIRLCFVRTFLSKSRIFTISRGHSRALTNATRSHKYSRGLSRPEVTKSIVKGIGIGFLSCIGIGIGIAKTISQVLVLVLLRGHPKYWYWYC